MPFSSSTFPRLDVNIRHVLRYAGTPQVSAHLERVGGGAHHRTYYNNQEEESNIDVESDDTIVYAVGSITKFLVALLMSIIVDELSFSESAEHQCYRTLREIWKNPWDVRFTDLFNTFSDTKIAKLPRNPTLRHVLLHFNSLPPMNPYLIAPDGRPLMSKDSFLRVAPRLAEDASGHWTEDYNHYSNGNYILIGLLIEAMSKYAKSKDNLGTIMHKLLFQRLGMANTSMGFPDISNFRIARPYVVTASGTRIETAHPLYPMDSIVVAAFGAYSCTRDLATLYRTLQACINGDANAEFQRDLVEHFLSREGILNDATKDRFGPAGICTTLDTSTAGCRSFNRLICPESLCSTYRLGHTPKGKAPRVYYSAGTIQGYASCTYWVPKSNIFIIVLTNSTSFTDAADHISRLILQDGFSLRLSKRDRFNALRERGYSFGMRIADLVRVDVVDMSRRAASEGRQRLQKFAEEDTKKDIPNLVPVDLEGRYYNARVEQFIEIKRNQDRLEAVLGGDVGTSRPMGLVRTGSSTVRLQPMSVADFTIDRYDSYGWAELGLGLEVETDERGNRRAVCLTRKSAIFVDKFRRERGT